MTNKDDFAIDFSGLTHDHTPLDEHDQDGQHELDRDQESATCSTIAILRRHPMYDCLVLVKKYRACLGGYVLEFPETEQDLDDCNGGDRSSTTNQENQSIEEQQTEFSPNRCNRRKLVSRFLDGDDPIYSQPVGELPTGSGQGLCRRPTSDYLAGLVSTLGRQTDDRGSIGELVHVPINGLLDRLKNYTQSGLAVDGRVYAFAMGLKTAERFLTTSAMHELQETPI